MGKLIVVASGKGGVGKTTLSANLAACLSERGNRVLAIDCDVYLKNLDIVFGASDEHIWDAEDAFTGRCTVKDAIVRVNGRERLNMLPAPLKVPEDPDGLSDFLLNTAKKLLGDNEYDYVIADCPSGIGRGVNCFFTRGSLVIVVATPDVTSIHDAEKVAAAAYEKGADTALVVNRIKAKAIESGTAPDIDTIIDRVCVKLIGLIPEDPKTSEALNAERLVVETKRARSKRAYENIASRVDGEFTELYRFW